MNLADGRIINVEESNKILAELEERIINTLIGDRLSPQTVIDACDRLVMELDEERYLEMMKVLGIGKQTGIQYINEARRLFSREGLTVRLKKELGEAYLSAERISPENNGTKPEESICPLGTLLHIAAGNAHGLPVFSVLEGLLTGNINILKLPSQESGISVTLLADLIRIEPKLSEYIYVFDYSSKDIENIGKLINVCDAVVLWGGSEAVKALRSLVPPHIKLIEWGHKISFAYVTPEGVTQEGLRGIARNIATTGQLLCSSIQGIYVDTDDMGQVESFCSALLPILEKECTKSFFADSIGIQTQSALRVYNTWLEGIYSPRSVYRGGNCSLTAYPDKTLEASIQYGNAWVRALPHREIVRTLYPYKNLLQTVGLLCSPEQRNELSQLLFKTGVVRVCGCENMSVTYAGAPHDGEYPLRRYVKSTELDQ
ncbi:MAG: acyl-CoA reductase [Eubacteriales bacterium]